jgi:hypothetical protein
MICSTCEARLKCGAKLCAQCGTRTAVPSQISLPCKDGLDRAEADQVDRLKQEDRGYCFYSGAFLAFLLRLLRSRSRLRFFQVHENNGHSAVTAQGSTISRFIIG